MKRTLSILLAALLALSLWACQSPEQKWQEQYDTGMRYLSELNYEEAIVAFTAAIEAEPKNTAAYLGRAEAYVAQAKASAPPSVEIKDWPEDLVRLYKLAENDYLAAIGIDKELAEAYLKLADLYVEQGEMDKAREILEEGFAATGDEEIAQKQEDLAPTSSLDNSEKNGWEEDDSRTYEYDAEGNPIGYTEVFSADGQTTTSTYNMDGVVLRILITWDDPGESGMISRLEEFSPEVEGRFLRHLEEKTDWTGEYVYTYEGSAVSIRIRVEDRANGFLNQLDQTVPYTMQNPDADARVTGYSWNAQDGLRYVEIEELDRERNTLCTAKLNPDGSPYTD